MASIPLKIVRSNKLKCSNYLEFQPIDETDRGDLKLIHFICITSTSHFTHYIPEILNIMLGYAKNVFLVTEKVQKKYHHLHHEVHLVTLEKSRRGLGISLAGHKDRNKMAAFICGINPKGTAFKNGELRVGDEILEVG